MGLVDPPVDPFDLLKKKPDNSQEVRPEKEPAG